jgi:transcription elongation GreA/GreB family factor
MRHHALLQVNKQDILNKIIATLRAELDTCLKAAAAATAAATDPDSKAENKYDTRSLEASYLARGQALRVAELEEAVRSFETLSARSFRADEPVAIGAIVVLEGADGLCIYFIGPNAGGTEVLHEGHEVIVITPSAPLGQKLMGRRQGASVAVVGQAVIKAVL